MHIPAQACTQRPEFPSSCGTLGVAGSVNSFPYSLKQTHSCELIYLGWNNCKHHDDDDDDGCTRRHRHAMRGESDPHCAVRDAVRGGRQCTTASCRHNHRRPRAVLSSGSAARVDCGFKRVVSQQQHHLRRGSQGMHHHPRPRSSTSSGTSIVSSSSSSPSTTGFGPLLRSASPTTVRRSCSASWPLSGGAYLRLASCEREKMIVNRKTNQELY
jgi:hypothetical protein